MQFSIFWFAIVIGYRNQQASADQPQVKLTAKDMVGQFDKMEAVIETFIQELQETVKLEMYAKYGLAPKLESVTELLEQKLEEGRTTIHKLAIYQERSMQFFKEIAGIINVIKLIVERREMDDSEKDWDKALKLLKKVLRIRDEL